jgi:hypothetical protein
MGCHHHIDLLYALALKVRDDALPHPAFAGIDEHGLIAELKEDRITLPDVDEVDDKVPGEPGDDLGLLPAGDGTAGGDDAATEGNTEQ